MDIIATHQASKFAREWTINGNGPLLLEFVTYRYGGHSYVILSFAVAIFSFYISRMSDPGTTYRTRDEIQRMRSTQDPIKGLQKYLEDWGVISEEDLKVHSRLGFITLHSLIHILSITAHRQTGEG